MYRHHPIACDGTAGLSDTDVQRELKEQLQRCHMEWSRSSRQTPASSRGAFKRLRSSAGQR